MQYNSQTSSSTVTTTTTTSLPPPTVTSTTAGLLGTNANTLGRITTSAGTKPIVLVAGATGKQGGSVVQYLLRDGNYCVRALTRHGDSDAGKKLKELGCELVEGDLCDSDMLVKALHNCSAFFVVTQFFENCTEENEEKQGKCAVDAWRQYCAGGNYCHLVLSALPSTEKSSGIKVPHFDAKWHVVEYLKSTGMRNYTIVCPMFYYQNFDTVMSPQLQQDGTYTLTVPLGGYTLPMIDISQLGGYVLNIIKGGNMYSGKVILLCSDNLTLTQICLQISSRYNVLVRPVEPKCEDMKSGGMQEEFVVMFQWFQWLGKTGNITRAFDNILPKTDLVLGSEVFQARTFHQWLLSGGLQRFFPSFTGGSTIVHHEKLVMQHGLSSHQQQTVFDQAKAETPQEPAHKVSNTAQAAQQNKPQ